MFETAEAIECNFDAIELAEKHDLAHLLGMQNDAYYRAVFRADIQDAALKELSAAFEKAGIDYMPLKGAVIRKYYPEPWMRTSCDIDIYINPKDLQSAKAVAESCGAVFLPQDSNSLHLQFNMPNGTALELHTSLSFGIESSSGAEFESKCIRGEGHKLHLNSEDFYAYHIYHMKEHFINGGCGIKPFLDIAVMKKKFPDLSYNGKYKAFEKEAANLAEYWFLDGKNHNATMENYVINGGVYGSTEQKVAAKASGKGKTEYALKRVFMPMDSMVKMYPVLEKEPGMLPFFWGKRAIDIVCGGKLKRAATELKQLAKKDTETEKLMRDLELI